MSEVPEDWNRITPALAGRISARGVPKPVAIFAVVVTLLICFGYKGLFSEKFGDAGGMLFSFLAGAAVGLAICFGVRGMSRADRDWFAIMCDWHALAARINFIKAWKRLYKW